jgi:hypothetical protein
MVSPYFFDQASHIRGPQTNFTVSLLSSNGLLAIFEKYTGARTINGSIRIKIGHSEPIGNNEDRKEIQCFHLNRLGNVNDDISSGEHFENSKPEEELIYY